MKVKHFLLAVLLLTAPVHGAELRLATTTSLENSGLLAHLLPAFERVCTCSVRVIPVGTGMALELGRRGDVDALLTHAPEAEKAFIAAGHGIDRREIAYNYFVLLMPPEDAAGVTANEDILAALHRIATQRVPFLSRGDDSGTHKKELALWQTLQTQGTAVQRTQDWYIEAGASMGQALRMADELGAYVLSDSGTYMHLRDKISLRPVPLPPSELLYNAYSVLRVNAQRHPHVNSALAKQFADWLGEDSTRQRIAEYRLFGEMLFMPIQIQ